MEWIDVKKRLPEEGVRVLTLDMHNPQYLEYRVDYVVMFENQIEEPYIWACTLKDDWDKVTHWMPLPEPPIISMQASCSQPNY